MYKSLIVALALAAPALATLPLLLQTTTTTGTGAAAITTVTGTTTLLSGTAALGLFSVVGIAAAIGTGLLLRGDRGKRSVNSLSTDASFAIISNLEPAQCYRRLICDVASGKMPEDDNNEIILAPFAQEKISEANPAAHTFEYLAAAEVGRALASIEKCELRYSCPLSGDQLKTIFNEAF